MKKTVIIGVVVCIAAAVACLLFGKGDASSGSSGSSGPWAIPAKFTPPMCKSLQLENGRKIDFCACPAGTFKMSNSGSKETHGVTITRPFWIGRTFFSELDVAELTANHRSVEKTVVAKCPDYDAVLLPWAGDINRYCEELNAKYGKQLPEGYVFRLPTEAELEYAVTAGKGAHKGDKTYAMLHRTVSALEKQGLPGTNILNQGFVLLPKTVMNKWGLTGPSWTDWSQLVLDRITSGKSGTLPAGVPNYQAYEVDPLRFGEKMLGRCNNAFDRHLKALFGNGIFRLVIGPDLVKEKAPRKEKSLPDMKKHVIALKPGVEIEFVECPPGSFTMGVNKDPKHYCRKHKVNITRPFWMATTKLTVGQWKAYKEGYEAPADCLLLGGDLTPVMAQFWGKSTVKYHQFDEFCAYLTKRFKDRIPEGYVFRSPTEAEWEYAYSADAVKNDPESHYAKKARNSSEYGFHSNLLNVMAGKKGLPRKAEWERSGAAVGCYPPNRWGLYDMTGNTRERMLDSFYSADCGEKYTFGKKQTALNYEEEETDPYRRAEKKKGAKIEHVGRGGDMGNLDKHRYGLSLRLCVGPDPKSLNRYPIKK